MYFLLKVVNREICQMTSKGTRLATTGTTADLCYLTAVSGQKIDGQNFQVGVCFVDTSVGTLNLSSFNDDSNFSKLGTMLAVYPPSELLYDPKALPAEMFKSVVQKHVYAANMSTGGVARFPGMLNYDHVSLTMEYFNHVFHVLTRRRLATPWDIETFFFEPNTKLRQGLLILLPVDLLF